MGDVEGSAGPGARVGIVGRDEVLARVLAVPIGVATVIVAAPGAGASTLLDAIAAQWDVALARLKVFVEG